MLWVDDDFVSVADLTSLDAEVVGTADAESLTLTGSNGIIRRSKEDCQATLERFMSFSNLSPTDLTLRDVNMPIGTPDLRYNYAAMAQLVISGMKEDNWSAIKRWVAARTLLRLYRAASNKNADRYEDRWEAMKDAIVADYWPNFRRKGLPLVFNPLVAPGALMERAGSFSALNLSLVAGTGTVTVAYDYAITWVGPRYVSATAKANQESYRSNRATLTMTVGNVARISIASLTPPDGTQPIHTKANSRYSPTAAVGWNVWAGLSGGTLYRQNVTPVLVATPTFTLPADPILTGEQADLGQYEDIILEIRSELQRC